MNVVLKVQEQENILRKREANPVMLIEDGVPGTKTWNAISQRYDKLLPMNPQAHCLGADVYHGDTIDIQKAISGGMCFLIAKATQGTSVTDPKFLSFKAGAAMSSLPFGSYHFGNGDDPTRQGDHYLSVAQPSDKEVACLDLEEGQGDSQMTMEQACAFVLYIQSKLGRYPMIYGGARLKEEPTARQYEILGRCPLWLSQYGPTAVLPAGWTKYTLWQFTGDGVGPPPHSFYSGEGNVDISRFEGSVDELNAKWPFA